MKLTDPPFDPDNIERQLTHAATQLLFGLCPEVEAAGAARQRRVMTAIQSQLAATVANMRADIKIAPLLNFVWVDSIMFFGWWTGSRARSGEANP